MILLSQIAFRRRLSPEEAKALKFKVPGGVATTAVGLVFLVFIICLLYTSSTADEAALPAAR